ERLRIDDGGVDVGEDLELAGAAHVVAVAGGAVGNQPLLIANLHLPGLERLDHAVLFGHAADPLVGFDAHAVSGSVGTARSNRAQSRKNTWLECCCASAVA